MYGMLTRGEEKGSDTQHTLSKVFDHIVSILRNCSVIKAISRVCFLLPTLTVGVR